MSRKALRLELLAVARSARCRAYVIGLGGNGDGSRKNDPERKKKDLPHATYNKRQCTE
jgi:hypothetical protein